MSIFDSNYYLSLTCLLLDVLNCECLCDLVNLVLLQKLPNSLQNFLFIRIVARQHALQRTGARLRLVQLLSQRSRFAVFALFTIAQLLHNLPNDVLPGLVPEVVLRFIHNEELILVDQLGLAALVQLYHQVLQDADLLALLLRTGLALDELNSLIEAEALGQLGLGVDLNSSRHLLRPLVQAQLLFIFIAVLSWPGFKAVLLLQQVAVDVCLHEARVTLQNADFVIMRAGSVVT